MSNVECRMSNVECRMSNVECRMSNVGLFLRLDGFSFFNYFFNLFSHTTQPVIRSLLDCSHVINFGGTK
ncbi:hypothetical protein [Lonepinella sp. BR2357]|uniref:hypothetical protein n=1 Tax=Lonepinella sp. BR2357 TaxID=3434549 RepID=UPI003F6DD555